MKRISFYVLVTFFLGSQDISRLCVYRTFFEVILTGYRSEPELIFKNSAPGSHPLPIFLKLGSRFPPVYDFLGDIIILRSGDILDSIQVNGQHFGAPSDRGPDINTINLPHDEKVTSIQYNIAKNGFSYCNFILHTNISSYGPYAIKDYCNMESSITRRNISNGEFLEFMQQHSQLNQDGQIELNECVVTGDNACDANASCTNIDGGFKCACNDGYQGDGNSCNEIQG